MGATDFTVVAAGADMTRAYEQAVRDAVDENGRDAYNGTISTTSGAYAATRVTMTEQGAAIYASAHVDDAEKWGPALAVPVAPVSGFTLTKHKFSVALDDGDEGWSPEYALLEKARRQALAAHGTKVHTVEVKHKVRTKVVTTPAAGKPVLKWQAGSWNTFDTKAQAVAYAKQSLKNRSGGEAMAVKQVRVWPDSTFGDKTAAVRVSVETVQAVAEVTVTVAEPKAGLTVKGWLFFGLAAC
jgi:hypothetical protein